MNRTWLGADARANHQGSSAINGYLYADSPDGNPRIMIQGEADPISPLLTPFLADSIWVDAWPEETECPARNLVDGDIFSGGGASRFAIPRHKAARSAAVKNFSPRNSLPGAVNAGFADNHVEAVRAERLWELTWHKTWKTPEKRPGR